MGSFNHTLRDALVSLKITQNDLAAKVGKTPSQISRWLASATLPDPASLVTILAAFPDENQSALAAAYVTDILPPGARHLLTILPTHGSSIAEQAPEATLPAGISAETRQKLIRFAHLLLDFPEVEAIVDELLSLASKLK